MSRHSLHTDKTVEQLKAVRLPINERCKQKLDGEIHICSRSDGELCGVYAFPKTKWLHGDCPMADNELKTIEEKEVKKVRVGQQKQKRHR